MNSLPLFTVPIILSTVCFAAGTGLTGSSTTEQVEVKSYPAHRVAYTEGRNLTPLKKHFERLGFDGSNPIYFTLDPDDTWPGQIRYAATGFIYPDSSQGKSGWDGSVLVKDWPEQKVLSLAFRGDPEDTDLRAYVDRVRQMALGRNTKWSPIGPLRLVSYDGELIPMEQRRHEIQLPVVTKEEAVDRAKQRSTMRARTPEPSQEVDEALGAIAEIIRSWKKDEQKLARYQSFIVPPYQKELPEGFFAADRFEEVATRVAKGQLTGATLYLPSQMGDQRLFDPLVTLLEHPRWVVGREAAFALGNLGDKRAVPILLKALEQKKTSWNEYGNTVVPAIASALGKLADRQAVQPIRDALLMAQHDDNLQSIRYRTVDGQYIYVPDSPYKIALAKLNEKEFLPAVRAYARDNLMSPQAGLDMLIAMRDEQAFEICMEHLESENKAFQLLAIRKLVDLGDSRAIGELKRLANDPDENVRSAAKWSVVRLEADE